MRHSDSFIVSAQHLMDKGEYSQAIEALEKSAAQHPDQSTAYIMIGYCLHKLSRSKEGLAAVNQGLRNDPEDDYGHRIRSIILSATNQLAEAKKSIERALELDPDDPYHYLQAACFLEAKGKWKEALKLVDRALEIDPNNEDFHVYRSHLLGLQGKKKEALQSSLEALRNNPDEANSHSAQGYALLSSGDHRGASEAFLRALRINANSEYALDGLRESLRARFVFYRMLLNWNDAMYRLGKGRFSGTLIIVIFFRILTNIFKNSESKSSWLSIAVAIGAAALLFLWMSAPITNIALLFHPQGRYLLSSAVKLIAVWFLVILGWIGVSALALALGFKGGLGGMMGALIFALLMLYMLAVPEQLGSRSAKVIIHVLGALALGSGLILFIMLGAQPA